MTRQEAKKIFDEVVGNRKKLAACPRHQFAGPIYLGARMRCVHCGGEMTLTDLVHYIDGYEAAGRPADDIYSGWRTRMAKGA